MSIQTIQTLAHALIEGPQDDRKLAEQVGTITGERAGTNALLVVPSDKDFQSAEVERERETNRPTSITLVPANGLTLGDLKASFEGYWESPPRRPGSTPRVSFDVEGNPYRVRIFATVAAFQDSATVKAVRIFQEAGFG